MGMTHLKNKVNHWKRLKSCT